MKVYLIRRLKGQSLDKLVINCVRTKKDNYHLINKFTNNKINKNSHKFITLFYEKKQSSGPHNKSSNKKLIQYPIKIIMMMITDCKMYFIHEYKMKMKRKAIITQLILTT